MPGCRHVVSALRLHTSAPLCVSRASSAVTRCGVRAQTAWQRPGRQHAAALFGRAPGTRSRMPGTHRSHLSHVPMHQLVHTDVSPAARAACCAAQSAGSYQGEASVGCPGAQAIRRAAEAGHADDAHWRATRAVPHAARGRLAVGGHLELPGARAAAAQASCGLAATACTERPCAARWREADSRSSTGRQRVETSSVLSAVLRCNRVGLLLLLSAAEHPAPWQAGTLSGRVAVCACGLGPSI